MPPRREQRTAEAAAAATIARALREEDGDVLVFLPGAAEIRRVERDLRASVPPDVDVHALYGALAAAEQDAALAPSPPGRRRIVLATDIAETSLTVEGVRVVVDAGLARAPRHDPRTGLTRLHTAPASRASADQRAGRAGRTEPGVAYRLWSKVEHAARRPFADPEIVSVELSGLALELAVWGSAAADLPFLDQPPDRALDDAAALLRDLGAVDEDGRPTDVGRAMAELPLHPRLGRMVVAAARSGDGPTACALAALLEERDVLRGRPDELPVDVGDRVRLLVDPAASHPAADGRAVAAAGRRARDIGRRAGVAAGAVDLSACGRVLALAYPDRVAQARGNGRFRMRTGSAAWVPAGDPLAAEPFIVAAELDADRRDSRVRMAAGLDAGDVEAAAGSGIERVTTTVWDPGRDDLRTRVEARLGALVLQERSLQAEPGPATTAALVDRVRVTGLGLLRGSEPARMLQQRADFARRIFGDWPDVSDRVLLAELDEWLAPLLVRARGRADLEEVDLVQVVRARLGYRQVAELDDVAPPALRLPGGRSVAVDYGGDQPAASARVQDLYGTTDHPTVARGRVPVVLHLLSPAGRPVQVTADLPGFWAGSWREVRKEMAGRYPKHPWPADPASAVPGRRRRP